MAYGLEEIASELGVSALALVLIIIWSIIWKAIALWKSARRNHLVWFILLLVINTLGILEILYIFLFADFKKRIAKEKKQSQRKSLKTKKRK
ncbi:MAG: DUF5652 family protein [archaeon]